MGAALENFESTLEAGDVAKRRVTTGAAVGAHHEPRGDPLAPSSSIVGGVPGCAPSPRASPHLPRTARARALLDLRVMEADRIAGTGSGALAAQGAAVVGSGGSPRMAALQRGSVQTVSVDRTVKIKSFVRTLARYRRQDSASARPMTVASAEPGRPDLD